MHRKNEQKGRCRERMKTSQRMKGTGVRMLEPKSQMSSGGDFFHGEKGVYFRVGSASGVKASPSQIYTCQEARAPGCPTVHCWRRIFIFMLTSHCPHPLALRSKPRPLPPEDPASGLQLTSLCSRILRHEGQAPLITLSSPARP